MTHVGSEVSLSRLELVVLARLSSAKAPGPKDLGQAVSTLALPAESPARARQRALETLEALWQRGLVASQAARIRKISKKAVKSRRSARRDPAAAPKAGRRLTDEGRRALCRAFGLEAPPTWSKIRDAHLPALGFGLAPASEEARRHVASGEAIVTAVLRSELGIENASTVTALCDALIFEALGLPPGKVTLQRIRAHVLARRIGIDTRGEVHQIATRAVSAKLGARDARRASLARALARRWASQVADGGCTRAEPAAMSRGGGATRTSPDARSPTQLAPSAEALLAMVREAIPAVGADGRYGPDKIFVSALWQQISHDARMLDYTLDRFKHWLVTANRDRLLDLARADLVGAMDPRQVAESEIEDVGATFHFVLDRRVRSLDANRRSHAR